MTKVTVEELEAEGNAIVAKFEEDFTGIVRPFYASLAAYGEKVQAADISDAMKLSLMKILLAAMENIEKTFERVAKEEGIG